MSTIKKAVIRTYYKELSKIDPNKIFAKGQNVRAYTVDGGGNIVLVSHKLGDAVKKYSELTELYVDPDDFLQLGGGPQTVTKTVTFSTSPQVPDGISGQDAVSFTQFSTMLPDGVLSGFSLSISGSNVLHAAGVYRISGISFNKGSGSNAIDAQDATQSRYDILVGNNSGVVSVISGALSATPVYPAIPSNSILIGAILITPTSVTTVQPIITDYVNTTTDQNSIGGVKTFLNSISAVSFGFTGIDAYFTRNNGEINLSGADATSFNAPLIKSQLGNYSISFDYQTLDRKTPVGPSIVHDYGLFQSNVIAGAGITITPTGQNIIIDSTTTGSSGTNGLTGTTSIGLGGALTGNTSIGVGANSIEWSGNNGTWAVDYLMDNTPGGSLISLQAQNAAGSRYSAMNISAQSGSEYAQLVVNKSGLNSSATLNVTDGIFLITDGISSKGAIYGADYSANFTARSLIDKGYADAHYGSGSGTVTTVSVVTANGVSGSVANASSTPAITLTLGAITPTSVNGVSAATMAFNDATSSIQTQLNSKLSSSTAATTYMPLAGGTFTGDVQQATAPVNATSLVNKSYVDNLITGITWKNEVRAATTANITLSGTQTVDGIALIAGDRVLVKNQTTQTQNGIYIVAAGAWTRSTDADSGTEIGSATVLVRNGTINKDTQWTCTNSTDPVIGTDNITFGQIAGAGVYSNGTGILLTGNVFSFDSTYGDGRYGQLTNPLSQFAVTTSAQLAGVISDETGTGALVFANSPILAGTPSAPSLAITGTAGLGFMNLPTQSSPPTTPSSGFHNIYVNSSGQMTFVGSNGFGYSLSRASLTASRTYTFPDSNGTFAMIADVINQPLTGYSSGAGTVSATDSILQAIQKLNGNDALKAPLASPTFTGTPASTTGTVGDQTTQIATEQFVFQNQSGYDPNYFYPGSLYKQSRISLITNTFLAANAIGNSLSPTHITFLGDSRFSYSPNFILDAVAQYGKLNSLGFVSPWANIYGSAVTWSQTASIATRNDATSAQTWGIAGARIDMATGNTWSVTPSTRFPFDKFRIYYNKTVGGGTFSYSIDGGAATNVNTDPGSGADTLGVVVVNTSLNNQSSHTILLTGVSGSSRVYGMDFQNQSQDGYIVDILQSGGSRAQQWATSGVMAYTTQYLSTNATSGTSPAAVVVWLDINDANLSRTSTQYIADIRTIVSNMALPTTSSPMFITYMAQMTTSTSGVEDTTVGAFMSGYRTELLKGVPTDGWSVIDAHASDPAVSIMYANGYYQVGDNQHHSTTYATARGQLYVRSLFSGVFNQYLSVGNYANYIKRPILIAPTGVAGFGLSTESGGGAQSETGTGWYGTVTNGTNVMYFKNAGAATPLFQMGSNGSTNTSHIVFFPTSTFTNIIEAFRQGSTSANAFKITVNSNNSTTLSTNNAALSLSATTVAVSAILTVGTTVASGVAGTASGAYSLSGVTSGTISILPQAAAGTYNFNMPITAGSAGQVLTSQAGGATAMTWSSVKAADTINTATDANYTVTSATQMVKLPVVTANRTVSIPAAASYTGLVLIIWNQNTSGTFTWSFTGATVKDAANNSLSTLVNSSVYFLESDGTNWLKLN